MTTSLQKAASCGMLAALACWLAMPPAWAQATVDPHALDDLTTQSGAKPSHPPAKPAAPAKAAPAAKPAAQAKPAGPAATPAPSTPAVPTTPPPAPVLPPPVEVPVRPAEKPVPPVKDGAPGGYSKLPGGLRITFGAGSSDLNPDTAAALNSLSHAAAISPDLAYNVAAYAAGTPDDPSTARRLSLSRALAARAVLIAGGVPSIHIYVKALGASVPVPEGVPADRVDVTISTGAPASAAASPPSQ